VIQFYCTIERKFPGLFFRYVCVV